MRADVYVEVRTVAVPAARLPQAPLAPAAARALPGVPESARVVGVGVDVADHASMGEAWRRWGAAWAQRWCSARELAAEPVSSSDRGRGYPQWAVGVAPEPGVDNDDAANVLLPYLADRWAAKEALTKVLRPGADVAWPWPTVELVDPVRDMLHGTSAWNGVFLRGRAGELARSVDLRLVHLAVTRVDGRSLAWSVGWTPGPA